MNSFFARISSFERDGQSAHHYSRGTHSGNQLRHLPATEDAKGTQSTCADAGVGILADRGRRARAAAVGAGSG